MLIKIIMKALPQTDPRAGRHRGEGPCAMPLTTLEAPVPPSGHPVLREMRSRRDGGGGKWGMLREIGASVVLRKNDDGGEEEYYSEDKKTM